MNDRYLLSTPENVPLSFELAGLGSRFVAALLDNVFIFVVEIGLIILATIVLAVTGYDFINSRESDMAPLAALFVIIAIIVGWAVFFLYPLIFEIVWNGQTPGKRIAGIRIVRNDGAPITAIAAVIRNVMRTIDFLPVYYTIGAITMIIDKKYRRLGDLAAGTICIKERRDAVVSLSTLAQPVLASLPKAENDSLTVDELDKLRRLTSEDLRLAKDYLQRRSAISTPAAERLSRQIAERLASKLGVDFQGMTPDEFLTHIVAHQQQLRQ